MSQFTRIARIVGSKDIGKDSHIANFKRGVLAPFSGVRVDYRGMERVNGENAHIFNLLVIRGSEERYDPLLELIGDKFYQGNQFVIYKWIDRTPAPTPQEPTLSQARNAQARFGYKVNITWGVPAFDPSIQPLRFEKRA